MDALEDLKRLNRGEFTRMERFLMFMHFGMGFHILIGVWIVLVVLSILAFILDKK
jgi:hypothetical protein